MAAYTQIIEFFGVPACGKSTIVNEILDKDNSCSIKYNELTKEFLQASLIKKILSIPLNQIFVIACLGLYIELKKSNGFCFRMTSLMKTIVVYRYSIKFSKYNKVYVDHGLIQGFVSLIGGNTINNTAKYLEKTNYILSNYPNVQFVFCQINLYDAITRLKQRGNHIGRFNEIIESDELYEEYDSELKRFNFIINDQKRVVKIDTSKPLKETISRLQVYLNQLNYETN